MKSRVLTLLLGFSLLASLACTQSVQAPAAPAEKAAPKAAAVAAPEFTWKYAHTGTEASTKHWVATRLKEILEKESGGRVKMDIFPLGQLYSKDPEMVMATAEGTVQFSHTSNSYFEPLDGGFIVFSLPGLFTDHAQTLRFFQSEGGGKELDRRLAAKGLKVLGWNADDRHMMWFTKKPASLAAVKGLKMRSAANTVMSSYLKTMGASLVAIPGAEAYTALQQGVADGVITMPKAMEELKWDEICKSGWESIVLGVAAYPTVMNLKLYETMPADIRTIITQKAMPAALEYAQKMEDDMEAGAREYLTKRGMSFFKLSAADDAEANKLVAGILPEYEAKPELAGLIKAAKETR